MQASAAAVAFEPEIRTPPWSALKRVAFRLCFLYFGLYCLTNQILGGLFPIPGIDVPELDTLPPVRPLVFWTASHVFHIQKTLVFEGSGSGDKTFDWVLSFCLLFLAALGTVIWSVADRKRANYDGLYRWFRLAMRFGLGSELLLYGIVKAVPLQMPFPFLSRLVEPYGNFSPMGVLWSFVGSSRGYESFVGCAELLGGVLLLVPRTATLGALIALADMTQVFVLNMTYDVPVKLLSFHLVLLSLVLLAPDLPRLFRFFLLNRATEAGDDGALFRSPRANRMAVTVQVVFGILLLALNAWGARKSWFEYGPGRPKSPLYGIWNVRTVPAGSDWRRVIFDFPNQMSVQKTDDSVTGFALIFNLNAGTFSVKGGKDTRGGFHYERTTPAALHLKGTLDNAPLDIWLDRMDETKFVLLKRGFHWIQEYPVNR